MLLWERTVPESRSLVFPDKVLWTRAEMQSIEMTKLVNWPSW